MKISEMNNEQAMDAMVRISGVLSFILEDKEVKDLVTDLGAEQGSGLPLFDVATKYLRRIVTVAAQRHRESLYEIVGALEQKEAKEVAKMNFLRTYKVIQENWSELKSFFPSTGSMTETTDS